MRNPTSLPVGLVDDIARRCIYNWLASSSLAKGILDKLNKATLVHFTGSFSISQQKQARSHWESSLIRLSEFDGLAFYNTYARRFSEVESKGSFVVWLNRTSFIGNFMSSSIEEPLYVHFGCHPHRCSHEIICVDLWMPNKGRGDRGGRDNSISYLVYCMYSDKIYFVGTSCYDTTKKLANHLTLGLYRLEKALGELLNNSPPTIASRTMHSRRKRPVPIFRTDFEGHFGHFIVNEVGQMDKYIQLGYDCDFVITDHANVPGPWASRLTNSLFRAPAIDISELTFDHLRDNMVLLLHNSIVSPGFTDRFLCHVLGNSIRHRRPDSISLEIRLGSRSLRNCVNYYAQIIKKLNMIKPIKTISFDLPAPETLHRHVDISTFDQSLQIARFLMNAVVPEASEAIRVLPLKTSFAEQLERLSSCEIAVSSLGGGALKCQLAQTMNYNLTSRYHSQKINAQRTYRMINPEYVGDGVDSGWDGSYVFQSSPRITSVIASPKICSIESTQHSFEVDVSAAINELGVIWKNSTKYYD